MLLVGSREGQNARRSMVYKEDEDVVLDRTLEDFSSLNGLGVAHHDGHESFGVKLVARVVQRLLIVHVVALRVVEDLAGERVFLCRGNVVAGHEDDFIRVHALLNQNLVRVVGVSLMPVIVIATRTRDDDGPVVSG